jgi:hypothetical protein
MVVHWNRNREPGWRRSQMINGFGGCVTFVVAIIVGATKFTHGAWISMSIMGLLVLILWRVHVHYVKAAKQLSHGLDGATPVAQQYYAVTSRSTAQTVVIPVDEINQAVLRSVAYARSISSHATAVHVSLNREESEHLRQMWEQAIPDVPFVTVDSPYRSLVQPILAYLDALTHARPGELVTVVLPEFITRWPWERFLHNQLAIRLKKALASRSNTVIVEVPYHLQE